VLAGVGSLFGVWGVVGFGRMLFVVGVGLSFWLLAHDRGIRWLIDDFLEIPLGVSAPGHRDLVM